jgi:branched-chain amino acid aminotransferase
VPRAKITGLYVTNAFAKTEAVENGFDEAIMLTPDGHVAEGTGENVFLIIDGQLVTTPGSDGILVGINRNTVITLAREELGIETVERHIGRNELYTADECFLTGTAVHFVPITEIDRRKIADGNIGKVSAKLQKLFHEVILNNNRKYSDWCTPVYKK